MKAIVQKEDPVLRLKAKEVPIKDIAGTKIKRLLKEMREALSREEDGVALAAPQIGASLRIFIIADTLPETPDDKNDSGSIIKTHISTKAKNTADPEADPLRNTPRVYINPTFVKLSREKAWMDEGCLSVRPFYGKVSRSKKATVRAYDEHGVPFMRGASGLVAQIFQHEIDHLDGVLFIDKAKDVVEVKPQEAENE